MPNDTKVKILISYHKPFVLLKDEVFTPIHVGRALATEASKDGSISQEDYQWMLDNMIGDDTGDNISHLNREFCELTAVYWAWKNYDKLGNPDYIGFMHYRRHLNFNLDKVYDENKWRQIFENIIDQNYIEKYHLKAEYIKNIVKDYDLLTVKKMLVSIYGDKNNYEQFKRACEIPIKDYDKSLEILEKKYPEYKEDINNFNNSIETYYTNIFIMKKELFFNYCNFLFSILFDINKEINTYNYSAEATRAVSQIAERIFSIYLYNLYRKSIYNIIELQRTMVVNTDIFPDVYPKSDNAISICYFSNNNNIPYVSVSINSIIKNSSNDNIYDIYIIDDMISDSNKETILSMRKNNIYIKFINKNYIKRYINEYNLNINDISKYYLLFMPNIFYNFKKIIYLDFYTILEKDISLLFNLNFSKSILVSQDINMIRKIFIDRKKYGDYNNYNFYNFNIKNIDSYFDTNIIVFNVKKFIDLNISDIIFKYTKNVYSNINTSKQILNIACEDNFDIIDFNWNFQADLLYIPKIIKELPLRIYSKYIYASKNINILNYNSKDKPWNNPNIGKSYIWWKYARTTPFYENILLNNIKIQNNIYTNNYYTKDRFSIGDFIFSILNEKAYIYITILGIKITLKKQILSDDSNHFNKKLDKLFSIYENKKRTRVTVFGIKIFNKIK